MHLVNTTAIKPYSGLKHTDDRHDALWLAELLRLGVLPEGYIMPKEVRGLRDLLRRRAHLVKLRTSLIISNQCTVARNLGLRIGAKDLNRMPADTLAALAPDEMVLFSLRSGRAVVEALDEEIEQIVRVVERHLSGTVVYRMLLTIPGVGTILAMTILLETGPIGRFEDVGHYVSYCRKVRSQWTSNDRVKGAGNKRNGNRYLAWAFSEAAQHALRASGRARAFYERKAKNNHFMVAHGALAHKLARAAYYIMRDKVPFDEKKLFG
jgi:transposase